MKLETFKQFLDYELLDTGDGYRLEQWGNIRLQRPDPQVIWSKSLSNTEWDKADATFIGTGERGKWQKKSRFPTNKNANKNDSWEVYFRPDIKLVAKLTPFKHTGIFAEQASNWEWLIELLTPLNREGRTLKILNLFAYTGGATMVLTRLGHKVTHVDASKPSIAWAKENQLANKFAEDSIRWILDDATKFAERELKRGEKYDGIIMDPPAFGHSPTGKTWKFNRDLPKLLETCVELLSDDAKFLLINGYATNSSALSLNNILEDKISKFGSTRNTNHRDNSFTDSKIEFGELCLEHKLAKKIKPASTDASGRQISTGIFARWQN